MAEINLDFYSAEQQDDANFYGVKRFVKTYRELLNSGDLPFNQEWDKTISPYAISPTADGYSEYDNDLVNKCWCFPNLDDFDTTTDNPENVKREMLYDETQTYYPFLMQWGDGGQGVGYGYANYNSRNAYDQTEISSDYNVKANNYIATEFKYNRLVYVIQVYISSYGRNNASLTANNIHNGSWRNVADITDTQFNDILSGQTDISGVRFVPYYASGENSLNTHTVVNSMQFKPLCEFNTLDKAELGDSAAYTDDYIDYMINSFGGIGSFGGDQGYTTTALGHVARYGSYFNTKYRVEWSWILYSSLADWCSENFTPSTNYDKFGTFSVYWNKTVIGVNSYQYAAFRQYLNTTMLDTKEKIIDYLCTQCAYLGCYFALSNVQTDFPLNSSNPNCYLGCIEEDGMTHGRYVKGAAIANEPYGDDVDDIRTAVNWIPPTPTPDPNEYSDETAWAPDRSIANFNKAYILSDVQVQQLHSKFFAALDALPTGEELMDYVEDTFLTNNPTDVIMSLRYYNLDITQLFTTAEANVMLGRYDTELVADTIVPGVVLVDYGSCTYFPHFGDFRDYEPYSTALLIIPYCGTVKINPSDFMGQTISVKMAIDFITGGCTAYIQRNGLVIESISGQMGVEIPVTAIATQDLQRNLFNSAIQTKSVQLEGAQSMAKASLSFLGAAQGGSVMGMAGAVTNAIFSAERNELAQQQAEYNLEHTQVPFKQVGAADTGINVKQEQDARLIVYRPVMDPEYDPEIYGRTTGFATLINSTLEQFSGFTKCATVKLDGIAATAQEKQQLRKLLQSGVYL